MACYETCVDKGESCELQFDRFACAECGKVRPAFNVVGKGAKGCAFDAGSSVDPPEAEVSEVGDQIPLLLQKDICKCEARSRLAEWLLSLVGLAAIEKSNVRLRARAATVKNLQVETGLAEGELGSKPNQVIEPFSVSVSKLQEGFCLPVQNSDAWLQDTILEEAEKGGQEEATSVDETAHSTELFKEKTEELQEKDQIRPTSLHVCCEPLSIQLPVSDKIVGQTKRETSRLSRSPSKGPEKALNREGTPITRGLSRGRARSRSNSRSPSRCATKKGFQPYSRKSPVPQCSYFSSLTRRATTIPYNTSPTDTSAKFCENTSPIRETNVAQRRSPVRSLTMTWEAVENKSQNQYVSDLGGGVQASAMWKENVKRRMSARPFPETPRYPFHSCQCPDTSPKSKCLPIHCSENVSPRNTCGPNKSPIASKGKGCPPGCPKNCCKQNQKCPPDCKKQCCQNNQKNVVAKQNKSPQRVTKPHKCGDVKCPCAGQWVKSCNRAKWSAENNKPGTLCANTESSYSSSKENDARCKELIARYGTPKQASNGPKATGRNRSKSPATKSCSPDYCKQKEQKVKYYSVPKHTIQRCEFRLVPTCIRKTGPKSNVEEYLSRFQISVPTIVRPPKPDRNSVDVKNNSGDASPSRNVKNNSGDASPSRKQSNTKPKSRRKTGGKGRRKKAKLTQGGGGEGDENGNASSGGDSGLDQIRCDTLHLIQLDHDIPPSGEDEINNSSCSANVDCDSLETIPQAYHNPPSHDQLDLAHHGLEEKGRCVVNYQSEYNYHQVDSDHDTLAQEITHPYQHNYCNIHASPPGGGEKVRKYCQKCHDAEISVLKNINFNALPPKRHISSNNVESSTSQDARSTKKISLGPSKSTTLKNKNSNAFPKAKTTPSTNPKASVPKNTNVNALHKTNSSSKTSVSSIKSKANKTTSKTQAFPELDKEIENRVQELKQTESYSTSTRYHESSFFNFGVPDSKRGDHGGEPHFYMPRRSFAQDFDPGEDAFLRDSWMGPKGPDERIGAEAVKMAYAGSREDVIPELTSAVTERPMAIGAEQLTDLVKPVEENIGRTERTQRTEQINVTEDTAPENAVGGQKEEQSRDFISEPSFQKEDEDSCDEAVTEEFNPFPDTSCFAKPKESSVDGESSRGPVEMPVPSVNTSSQIPVFASLFDRFDDTVEIFVRTKTSSVDDEAAGPSSSYGPSSLERNQAPAPESGGFNIIDKAGAFFASAMMDSRSNEGTGVDSPDTALIVPSSSNVEVDAPFCDFSPGTCVDPVWLETAESGYTDNFTVVEAAPGSSVDPGVENAEEENTEEDAERKPKLEEVMKGNALFFKKVDDSYDAEDVRNAKAAFYNKLKTTQKSNLLSEPANPVELSLSLDNYTFQSSAMASEKLSTSMVDFIRLNGTPV